MHAYGDLAIIFLTIYSCMHVFMSEKWAYTFSSIRFEYLLQVMHAQSFKLL